MTLWLTFAAMTAAAVFAVLLPLWRQGSGVRFGSDAAVYRDQLEEIERDQAAGLIAEAEAKAARVEVSRRLLGAADAAGTTPSLADGKSATWRRRAVALVSLLMLPLGAGALYLSLGSPEIPSSSLVLRPDTPLEQRSVEAMVAQVEAYLERNPEDGRGWEVLAPIYMRSGRAADAVMAWRNALRLLGPSAEREAYLGEAMVAAANGIVIPEAKAAFERAVAIDANLVSARFYLGLAAEHEGRGAEAAKIWRDLLAGAPADAHWVGFVREALARVEGGPVVSKPPVDSKPVDSKPVIAPGGPSAADVEVAAKLPLEQQNTMIRGMVERLAERLKKDGSDLEGWLRLLRSYQVLGESEKARAAVADARRALANEPDKLQRLDEAVKGLGLEG